jgi:hypothetical protein
VTVSAAYGLLAHTAKPDKERSPDRVCAGGAEGPIRAKSRKHRLTIWAKLGPRDETPPSRALTCINIPDHETAD